MYTECSVCATSSSVYHKSSSTVCRTIYHVFTVVKVRATCARFVFHALKNLKTRNFRFLKNTPYVFL